MKLGRREVVSEFVGEGYCEKCNNRLWPDGSCHNCTGDINGD